MTKDIQLRILDARSREKLLAAAGDRQRLAACFYACARELVTAGMIMEASNAQNRAAAYAFHARQLMGLAE